MERQLSEIVQGLAEIQHLDDLLPYVLEAATEMFAADRAMFAVYDQEGRVRRSTRFNMKVGPDGRLPVSEKLIQQVLRGDRAVIIDDIFKHIDLASRDSVKMNDIRFVVAAQIKVGGTVSGILYIDKLHTPGPGHTEEQQSALIKLLASSVSLAMRNLQAVEKQKYQSLFTASVIHNTRNNLHVMRANMDLLKRLTLGQNVDEVIDTTVASLESLQTFATSVLRLYELEATRTSPLIWIDPSVELEQRAASLELYARSITDQPIQIELSEVSMILTDAARFGIILDELLLNAVRYTRVQQPVVISVSRSENPRVPPIHETIDPPQGRYGVQRW
ncbi:MAG: GAF domain-containing protein, partial [Pseudomonadota bacterium]